MSDLSYYGRVESQGKAWDRKKAIAWDDAWHALSVRARKAFLNSTKGPARPGSMAQPSTPADAIPGPVLAELIQAKFAAVARGSGKKGDRITVPEPLYDFAQRVRAIHRFHLLGPDDRDALAKYCRSCFYNNGELAVARVLASAEVDDPCRLDAMLERYVTSHRWPGWAAKLANLPLAQPVVDALARSPRTILLGKLAAAVPGPKADVARALEALTSHLAVFEDLDPSTFEITVGLLPVVHGRLEEASRPRARPPLDVVEKPLQVMPDGGLLGNDLRVFLLEVLAQPPRIRQDGLLFAKEEPRFAAALPPWPGWLVEMSRLTATERLGQAQDWATIFRFVEPAKDDDPSRLQITKRGHAWLASDPEDQYGALYETLRTVPAKSTYYNYGEIDRVSGEDMFFGVSAMVQAAKKRRSSYWSDYDAPSAEERQALREAVHRCLQALPLGRFVRIEGALAHLAFGESNPLTLGKKDLSTLTIRLDHARVPQLEEQVERAGRDFLRTLFVRRLLVFDTMQAAIDAEGNLCVARLARLDGYFGKKYKAEPRPAGGEARVIVQPDFSVVVIGLDPAPAVALSPFCDRKEGQAGQGAAIYKLSRESVVRAVAGGMKPAEIVNRLTKHASVAVPPNVLAEVREWANWTRLVNVRPVTVVRCPDRETAARVVAALGRKAEILGETLVGFGADRLAAADRAKLQAHGILVTKNDITVAPKPAPAAGPAPAAPAKRRGRPPKAR